ncbi:hypothetical protein ILYODFUR_018700 [Ilyodon furcidens]|uniref:Uncharacterized protein n=1 Tax=Ilyodon furcidens TaxID=33524 RepID=A0ABV0U980_9TELE
MKSNVWKKQISSYLENFQPKKTLLGQNKESFYQVQKTTKEEPPLVNHKHGFGKENVFLCFYLCSASGSNMFSTDFSM